MLNVEENQLLTRIGPGTPMGAMFRRYWAPALLSEEVAEADGTPVRVRLLGEQLVAFRDSQGRVGLLEEHCPHRGASLALGRNEENGLRCIYHGWKYEVTGQCVETPTEPAESDYKRKVRANGYPTREAGGIVWAYMGPPDKEPPFPEFQWLRLPPSHAHAFKTLEECNYAQALEGGLDHAHAAILHRGAPWGTVNPNKVVERQLVPRQYVQPTKYGFRYVAVRRADDDTELVRIIGYVAPWWTLVPPDGYGASDQSGDRIVNAWVPRDDASTWHFQYFYDPGGPVDVEWRIQRGGHHLNVGYRKVRNLDNWYLQERQAMKTESMSGLEGILTQDHAVNETQGPILDRTREHLAASDVA